MRQRVQGFKHPDTALCHNDLGMLLCQMGDLDLAVNHFKQALAVMENLPNGALQYRTAQILNNLGMGLWQRGEWKNALLHLRRALTIYQLTLGTDHPEARAAYQNLERLKNFEMGV